MLFQSFVHQCVNHTMIVWLIPSALSAKGAIAYTLDLGKNYLLYCLFFYSLILWLSSLLEHQCSNRQINDLQMLHISITYCDDALDFHDFQWQSSMHPVLQCTGPLGWTTKRSRYNKQFCHSVTVLFLESRVTDQWSLFILTRILCILWYSELGQFLFRLCIDPWSHFFFTISLLSLVTYRN